MREREPRDEDDMNTVVETETGGFQVPEESDFWMASVLVLVCSRDDKRVSCYSPTAHTQRP